MSDLAKLEAAIEQRRRELHALEFAFEVLSGKASESKPRRARSKAEPVPEPEPAPNSRVLVIAERAPRAPRAQKSPLPDDMKHCGACGEDKPRSEFHRNKSTKDGLAGSCKPCARAQVARSQGRAPVPGQHGGHRKGARMFDKPRIDAKATYRCTIGDCGEQVTGAKATQHAWDEHDERVPIEEALKFFERVQTDEEG